MMNRTSQAVPVVPADPYDALPALPEPVIPAAVVPRWCVMEWPSVTPGAVWLTAVNGEGSPIIAMQIATNDEDRQDWKEILEYKVRQRRARHEARPAASCEGPLGAPPPLRLLSR